MIHSVTGFKEKLAELQRRKLLREAVPVDARAFGDPLALQVEWTPAAGGGANFRTHRLVTPRPGRLEFRATGAMRGFAIGFTLVGLAAAAAFAAASWQAGRALSFWTGSWIGVPIGLLFAAIGIFMLWSAGKARVFDRGSGWFWVGREPGPGSARSDRHCRLTDIHAVQLLKEHCSSSKGPGYWSYELNLVRKDASRVHVVDHGALEPLREDARTLVKLLGCRLWDATALPAAAP